MSASAPQEEGDIRAQGSCQVEEFGVADVEFEECTHSEEHARSVGASAPQPGASRDALVEDEVDSLSRVRGIKDCLRRTPGQVRRVSGSVTALYLESDWVQVSGPYTRGRLTKGLPSLNARYFLKPDRIQRLDRRGL